MKKGRASPCLSWIRNADYFFGAAVSDFIAPAGAAGGGFAPSGELADAEAFCIDFWLSAKFFSFAAFFAAFSSFVIAFLDFFIESCFIASSAFIAGAAGAAGVAGAAGAAVWAKAMVVEAANAPAISVASSLFMCIPIIR